MPRSQPLHKATGGIAIDRFHGVNTQVHPSKLQEGELSASINNVTKWGDCRKEHGWDVVNGADLTAAGGAQSRMTTDHALFTGANAGPVTGVIPYSYTTPSAATLTTKYLAFCGAELYNDVGNASFDPSNASYQIHTWGATLAGDLPVWAEWDGMLFLSIGRITTAGTGNDIQVWNGTSLTDIDTWIKVTLPGWMGHRHRPRWMAINWGQLVIAGTYDITSTVYDHSTIHMLDLNAVILGTAGTEWVHNVLGDGGDDTNSPINGMIAFGDHIFVFTRYSDIVRLSWLTGLNIEGVDIGTATAVEDRDRRIAYQNGCAAGHSLVIAGQRLLWIADDGIWMLETSESLVPTRVSEKLDGPSGIWSQVNKAKIEGCYATYDEELRQVLFSVPLGTSTINSHVIVAQLPDNDYEANDFRTWTWGLRDRTAASMAYDHSTRTVLWGSSLNSGLLCKDSFSDTGAGSSALRSTNTASTGVTYTATTMADAGASFTVDELIGLPITIRSAMTGRVQTGWITDNTAGGVTFTPSMSPVPSSNDEYFIGGIQWLALLNEVQYEDEMFFGTGFLKLAVENGNATVYSEIYPDNITNPTVQSHSVTVPGLIPVTIPFIVGGQGEFVDKLYSDDNAASMKIGVREHGYTGTPKWLRVDLPVSRRSRTRRR